MAVIQSRADHPSSQMTRERFAVAALDIFDHRKE